MIPRRLLALVCLFFLPARAVAAPLDLDADFGACGVAKTAFVPRALLVQPDGKIVVAGAGLARHHPDGRPDRKFGVRGVVSLAGPPIAAALLQPDGKIVGTTTRGEGADADVVALRWMSDGTPDRTFGDDGVAVVTLPDAGESASGLVLQDDGALVIAASRGLRGASDAVLVRLRADGSRDLGFGTNGVVTAIAGVQGAPSVARHLDGKLVIAAVRNVPGDDDYFVLQRHLPDGSRDLAFGEAGVARVATDAGLGTVVRAVALEPDGAIVVAGDRDGDWRFARFRPGGTIDPFYGSGGVARLGG